jgi:alkyl hydroperoxide reductase subunit F
MLDRDLKEQLTAHFAELGTDIELVVSRSEHPQYGELFELASDLAETSPHVSVRVSDEVAALPVLDVLRGGQPTGVRFCGAPLGHELSSLVLAILNGAGKGKLPDAALTQRIKRLPRGSKVRTYVSLTCENCPDVVQALNQIALAHGALEHTTIDGGLVQDELERLNVQGVPSVFVGDDLVHSGRATLADLLGKLEAALGQERAASEATVDLGKFEVAVVGGGPAGVSAAIYSVRKGLRTVLIAERLGGQLQETKGIENLISVVYTEGPQLSANMDTHLRAYPVEVLEHRRVSAMRRTPGSTATELLLDGGERLVTDAVIVATGARWRELGVPGEKDYLGRGVAFCPHCDGPYYKGKKVAVVGGGNSGVEAAIDLAGICSEVVLFEYMDQLKADDVLVKKLATLPNARVITSAKTKQISGDGTKVVALEYEDRESGQAHREPLDGVFVQIGLSPNSAFVKDLVELNRFGEIVVDPKGRTSVPGIYAAGDVTPVPFKQIVVAVGDGAKTALTAFEDRMRSAPLVTAADPVTHSLPAST